MHARGTRHISISIVTASLDFVGQVPAGSVFKFAV